jgi:hypothetical protein
LARSAPADDFRSADRLVGLAGSPGIGGGRKRRSRRGQDASRQRCRRRVWGRRRHGWRRTSGPRRLHGVSVGFTSHLGGDSGQLTFPRQIVGHPAADDPERREAGQRFKTAVVRPPGIGPLPHLETGPAAPVADGSARLPLLPVREFYVWSSRRCLSVARLAGISLRASRRTMSGTRSLPVP